MTDSHSATTVATPKGDIDPRPEALRAHHFLILGVFLMITFGSMVVQIFT